MKKMLLLLLFVSQIYYSQDVMPKIDQAVKKLMGSAPAFAANLSLYVTDSEGKLIYDYNGNQGLSSASTQKIFTAAAALETLGRDYQYTTTASFTGSLTGGTVGGDLVICSSGDPTLGSWRYEGYQPENFKQKLVQSLREKGITKINGNLILDDSYFDFLTIPGGWPWDDVGNYYGAGVWGINWRENQFDMVLTGGQIKKLNVELPNLQWVNDIQTSGSSDQSLIFTAPHSEVGYIRGKLPSKTITVSGSMPNPPLAFGQEIASWLKESGIELQGNIKSASQLRIEGNAEAKIPTGTRLLKYQSPTLDKIIFYFMRRSVNMYGETLIKTLGKEKRNEGSYEAGLAYLKDFWKSKGINPLMINFADGSGLSPQNYVSARAEVEALLWSKKQKWYQEFYEGFPTQGNGVKMKSGTMKNTKSFAGYHTSKTGKNYVFAIIINNYQGGNVSDALYQVVNVLK